MSDFGRRFDPAELDQDGRMPSDADAAGLLATARDLEAYARADQASPSIDFEDRVMASIASEPPPRPAVLAGGVRGLLPAIRDAWRIVWTSGPPLAVRVQALALVLVVAVAVGSLGALGTVGALRLLAPDGAPAPTIVPLPSPSPTAAPSRSPSPSPSVEPSRRLSPSPGPTASPTPTASPSDDDPETPEPEETPDGTDDSSGPGSGD